MSNIKLPEADADGWMPWSGGENPVPGQAIDTKFRDGYQVDGQFADRWDWAHGSAERKNADGADDIIAFRLAPTAPVEASGSERALQDAVDFGVGFLVDGQRVSPERVTVCHGDNSPLRPQPSGETREAVARIIDPPCWAAFDRISKTPFLDNGVAARGAHEPYLQTSLSKADAILALLSARPLALGGQHSGGEAEAAWLEAEAQLSEISAAIGSVRFMDPPDGGSVTLAEQVRRMRLALEEAEAALATTPAADADRVRIAVEALDCIKIVLPLVRATYGPHHPVVPRMEALAALKSTAAKEGEKS